MELYENRGGTNGGTPGKKILVESREELMVGFWEEITMEYCEQFFVESLYEFLVVLQETILVELR